MLDREPKVLAVCDIGGGSTEVVVGLRDLGPVFLRSFDIGSMRLTSRFFDGRPDRGRGEGRTRLRARPAPRPRRSGADGGARDGRHRRGASQDRRPQPRRRPARGRDRGAQLADARAGSRRRTASSARGRGRSSRARSSSPRCSGAWACRSRSPAAACARAPRWRAPASPRRPDGRLPRRGDVPHDGHAARADVDDPGRALRRPAPADELVAHVAVGAEHRPGARRREERHHVEPAPTPSASAGVSSTSTPSAAPSGSTVSNAADVRARQDPADGKAGERLGQRRRLPPAAAVERPQPIVAAAISRGRRRRHGGRARPACGYPMSVQRFAARASALSASGSSPRASARRTVSCSTSRPAAIATADSAPSARRAQALLGDDGVLVRAEHILEVLRGAEQRLPLAVVRGASRARPHIAHACPRSAAGASPRRPARRPARRAVLRIRPYSLPTSRPM